MLAQFRQALGSRLSDGEEVQITKANVRFPNVKEASSRVSAETELSIQQLSDALAEVRFFNSKFEDDDLAGEMSGFSFLERNMTELLEKVYQLREWHRNKHVGMQSESDEKKLLLAEIAILLVTPYIHRMLTTEERHEPLMSIFDDEYRETLSPYRQRIRDLNFQQIDPVYSTRYDGVCLAGLMASVHGDIEHACYPVRWCCNRTWRKPVVSFWHRAHARVLASKFFGAITCLDMILTLGVEEEDDLILEKAVGEQSPLEVEGVVEKALLYDRASAERNLRFFTGLILTANSVIDTGYSMTFTLTKLILWGFFGFWFNLPWNRTEAELRGELCYAGSKEEIGNKLHFARFIWNLPETLLVKSFYRLGLARIRTDHEFLIPAQPRTADYLLGGEEKIPARIITNVNLRCLPDRKGDVKLDRPSRLSPLLRHKEEEEDMLEGEDVLLIHYHGGGFIALSSFSHENYTRIWARDVRGLTILSADYRLAPDYPFPYAFNDAYRTYQYAVEHCESQMGFVPRKIILAGDSAGGNLCTSVAVQAIKDNYRIPDGLLCIYPVVDMRRVFSPSLMWSVNDRIVPFVFLECCMSAYLGDPESAKETALDTRCSPALAEDAVLAKLPRVRIVVGDRDPLMDQSIKFANRLARLKVDVKCKIFQSMPHGFCSFIWPVVGVPEVEKCNDECSALLRELCKNNQFFV